MPRSDLRYFLLPLQVFRSFNNNVTFTLLVKIITQNSLEILTNLNEDNYLIKSDFYLIKVNGGDYFIRIHSQLRINTQKKMVKKLVANITAYFQEYCSNASVHGFQYIGEKNRTIFERIWWTIIIIICLSGCIISIHAVYLKWEDSPVLVNFANKGTPIYEIPFPAITICPEAKTRQDKFNFTKVMHKKEDGIPLTTAEETNFEYMSVICKYYHKLNYTNNETFSEEFYSVIDDIKPNFRFAFCSFFDVELEECPFVPIITEEGICYTYNMLDRNDIYKNSVIHFRDYHKFSQNNSWSLQNGYAADSGFSAYPVRAYLAGAKNGFTINIITLVQNVDYACKDHKSLQGYRVTVHSPLTVPRPGHDYFRVPMSQSIIGAIEPLMITTSKRVRTYSPRKRRCYFSKERPLKYFKHYSASNCDLECLTNYTLAMCNCVHFYMPRENGTQICGTGSLSCLTSAEREMEYMDLGVKLKLLKPSDQDEIMNLTACNCLPACSDLVYDVDTSQTNWNWKKWVAARRFPNSIFRNISHISSLTLFFKSDNFITTERNEVYGPLDFLANCGGLLGLFTGFSVLSLIEILYFLSIRIICNLHLHKQISVPTS